MVLQKKIVKIKTTFKKENESTKILNKLGVKRNKIIFLGKKLNVSVYNLHQKLNVVYKNINSFLMKLKGKNVIYTHAWEGGNEDHDSCFV